MVSCNYKGKTSYNISSGGRAFRTSTRGTWSMNNGEQVNDHIEEDDHTDNIVEYDGTNTLIHDTFNVRMDDDGDHPHHNKL